jgi:hypothetical protein
MITLPTIPTLDAAALTAAEAAHHFAAVLRAQWCCVWQRDAETVAAELNADLLKSLAIFQLNTQAAESVNALLDAIDDPRFSTRAPTSMPAYWGLTETGFQYSPPSPPIIQE